LWRSVDKSTISENQNQNRKFYPLINIPDDEGFFLKIFNNNIIREH